MNDNVDERAKSRIKSGVHGSRATLTKRQCTVQGKLNKGKCQLA